jgi:hypothetical protein
MESCVVIPEFRASEISGTQGGRPAAPGSRLCASCRRHASSMGAPAGMTRRCFHQTRNRSSHAKKVIPAYLGRDTEESAARQSFVDQAAHGERRSRDQLHDSASGDAADADGLAAIVAEGELVEIGLQIFRLDRARMRAEQPARRARPADPPGPAVSGSRRTSQICYRPPRSGPVAQLDRAPDS